MPKAPPSSVLASESPEATPARFGGAVPTITSARYCAMKKRGAEVHEEGCDADGKRSAASDRIALMRSIGSPESERHAGRKAGPSNSKAAITGTLMRNTDLRQKWAEERPR